MPPSPGHIHQLPGRQTPVVRDSKPRADSTVKVLYSLDGSDQSYLTVLSELQDVYIHPGHPGYGSDEEPGPLGSTLLKALAQGVCYASPECVPSPSSLDFSVYNLDPTPRPSRVPHSQPFGTPSQHRGGDEPSWSGKGFLSWALSEDASGTTLVKGRLMKEYDFESSRFVSSAAGGGGLEALMRRGGSSDGRGWGLEVVISLKMVNPAGKGEFSGRKEFKRMLFQGPGTASGSVLVQGPGIGNAGGVGPSPSRPIRPPASTPASRGPSTVPINSNAGYATGATANSSPRVVRPPPPANRSSGSSLPPSSMPMASSSSSQAGPSRPTSAAGQQSRPPLPPSSIGLQSSSAASGSTPKAPPPARSNAPTPPLAPQARPPAQALNTGPATGSRSKLTVTPPKPQPPSSTSRARNREITPPPLPRPRSPPPSTPRRSALRDLLQADGKMSPSMAKNLASNPALLALLKSIPDAKSESASTGANTAKGKGKAKESKSEINGAANGNGNGNMPSSSRSWRDGTPTPTAPKTAKVESIPGGCVNCGTMETTMWRVKSYADGTKKKVCDACGLYFNKHKEMRPKELWDTKPTSTSASTSGTGVKRPHPTPPPGVGIRHSPRLSRQAQGTGTDNHPPVPVPGVPESPSKRRRTSGRPPIQPSPRMATRSTARSDIGVGAGGGKMEPFPFSSPGPTTAHSNPNSSSTPFGFGTSPAVPLNPSHAGNGTGVSNTNANADTNDTGIEDMDLDALLAQLTSGNGDMQGGGNGMNVNQGGTGGLSLEELFASVDNAAATDDALAEDMMRFLAGLEDTTQDTTQEEASAGEGEGKAIPAEGTKDGGRDAQSS